MEVLGNIHIIKPNQRIKILLLDLDVPELAHLHQQLHFLLLFQGLIDQDILNIGTVLAHIDLVLAVIVLLGVFLGEDLLNIDMRRLKQLVIFLVHHLSVALNTMHLLLILLILLLIFLIHIALFALVLLLILKGLKLILQDILHHFLLLRHLYLDLPLQLLLLQSI